MKTTDVFAHFNCTQQGLAKLISAHCWATPIGQSSIAQWGEFPPQIRQIQIQLMTGGDLQAEPGLIPFANKRKK